MSSAAAFARIGVNVADGVAWVTIDNPAKKNALTRSMCLQIQELMPTLEKDPAVTVVAVRGAGTTFSAGATINELSSVLLDRQEDNTYVDQLSLADQAITSITKPTVALVDGACMGGGWQIASACDFIIASQRSVFAITPAKIGIIYPRAGIERLVRQVGHANAKFILFTGETFNTARALDLGLVAEVVPDDEFDDRCRSLLHTLRNRSRFSTHSMKRLVDLTASNDPRIDQEWENAWAAMTDGPDMGIGITAFMNREQPEFTWSPIGRTRT
ncbi:enoyl-CoA hydratase/isomerase family protein [Arthrobacter sp. HMWF013]|uniref:enoyl-CoA hydratase/isomerase family protein n=1 Tax=Arthrobacter sp. HMWF013 TaxID=2056849 RepID=UPI000D398D82|nr:enoyl-CoA hydratase/isomerase family protein [Arthrobacter sp. HMWF013]PTT68843.1 enoyl-CoA hydratase/isomerase family protein [Arthrobacter sp. HMWF013]